MTAKVILNPHSNRWNAQARWSQAEAALKAAGVDFELVISDQKGRVTGLAEEAARAGFSPIIAAGGDGTIGETVNGMLLAAGLPGQLSIPLGIIPLGSANDFAFNIGLPTDLNEAARVIAGGKLKAIDLGKCNERYFINNSACGLEPYVTTKHERIHWIKGITRYLVAAVWAIMDKPEWRGKVVWDDGSYEGPMSFVSVGNGRRTGGFFMTPHADPFDGKLTLAFGYRGTRLGLLTALPKAFNEDKGNYVELEGMRELHSTRISIHLDRPSYAHTDGELFPAQVQTLEYKIFPKRLNVIMP
jgi:YegS/Rv2252/BmrU family lipid kinase